MKLCNTGTRSFTLRMSNDLYLIQLSDKTVLLNESKKNWNSQCYLLDPVPTVKKLVAPLALGTHAALWKLG